MPIPSWVTDKNNMGVFKDIEEKFETYLKFRDIEAKFSKALSSPEVVRIKTMAKQFGIAKMIPESVKTSLQEVCDISEYVDHLPPAALLTYVKLTSKALVGVCGIIGLEPKK